MRDSNDCNCFPRSLPIKACNSSITTYFRLPKAAFTEELLLIRNDSKDSGVIINIPCGFLTDLDFFDASISPCHGVTSTYVPAVISTNLLYWSLIRALSGLTYSTAYPAVGSDNIFDRIGKKAASVFPPAVAALIIISESLRNTMGIEFS
jgi:hypothetical protein